MNGDWSELRHPWERVKWARLYWQEKKGGATTARAAAKSLEMEENTYSAYEREPGDEAAKKKNTPLTDQRAIQFGEKFNVNWVWMLTGRETPFTRTPAQQRAVDAMATADEAEQERLANIIEAAVRRA